MKIIVTGGAGFIGSALIRFLIRETGHEVINVDALTYAGNLASLGQAAESPRYRFHHEDIRNSGGLLPLFETVAPDAVMHLAAESHVDRSIDGPSDFIQTNIVGTYNLLEAAYRYWSQSPTARRGFRLHHVSTDEVYGALGQEGLFAETTPYRPNSPYAASKAASDHLVRAWHHTYGLPVVMSNCSNNYGPYQHPEKLIPLTILNAIADRPLPVYGAGANVRDWLYVEDHVQALYRVLTQGRVGETYNIGGDGERSNLEVVRAICDVLDQRLPRESGSYHSQIQFVTDRPGHDFRYAIDASKARRELGWVPRESFESGLSKTVDWYLTHREWCHDVAGASGGGERLGLGAMWRAEARRP